MDSDYVCARHGFTQSGVQWLPSEPEKINFVIEDIAHALSNICRFGGHCRTFYSVAQHSCLVHDQMPTAELRKIALLHDATEAYCGDMIRAVKAILPDYQALENRLWVAIANRFKLPHVLPREVKEADNRMLVTEKRFLHDEGSWDMEKHYEPYPGLTIVPSTPVAAYDMFMWRAAANGLLGFVTMHGN